MKRIGHIQHASWMAALVLLAGCGFFSRGDSPIEPPAELAEFQPTMQLQRVWSTNLRGQGGRRLGLAPATDGARVFAGGSAGRVVAVDAIEGSTQWQRNTGLPLSAGPAYGEQMLIFGTLDGRVVALDAESGEQRWIQRVGGEVLARPAVSDRAVMVRTVDGRLLALSPLDGRQLWSLSQSVPLLSLRGNAAPVISGQRVVAGFDNGRIGAYSLTNGETVWEIQLSPPSGRTELERLVDINATPVIQDGLVYVAGYQGMMAALELDNGQVYWAREFSSYSGLAAGWGNVFGIDQSSQVYALSRNSGNSVWLNDRMRMRDLSRPVVLGNSLVVGDIEGYVHWLDVANGEFQARSRAGRNRVIGLQTVGDIVVAQTDGGSLTAWTPRRSD